MDHFMETVRTAVRTKTQPGVRAVEVALDILECIAFADDDIGVTEIASVLGLAKGAAYRHLQTLAERGYILQKSSTARYQIGLKAQLLGRQGTPRVNLLTASESPIADLRDTVGETVVLSSPEIAGARVLQTVPGKSTVEIGVRPGSILPFHASAQGKLLLAFAPGDFRKRAERNNAELAKWLSSPKAAAALSGEIARVRKQSWVESRGDFYRGVNAVAAPIFDETAQCVGAFAIVGLQQFLPIGKSQDVVTALLSAANRVSKALGYGGPDQRKPSRQQGRTRNRTHNGKADGSCP
jgi:IclR family KDG regulon transcriptional repressor